jgi:hypothetical protein
MSTVGNKSVLYFLSSICLFNVAIKLFDIFELRTEFNSKATDLVLSWIIYPVFSPEIAKAEFCLLPLPAVLELFDELISCSDSESW